MYALTEQKRNVVDRVCALVDRRDSSDVSQSGSLDVCRTKMALE